LNIDLAPTFLDFAQAKVPGAIDGQSLKPLLQDPQSPWRKDFFYDHHYHVGGKIARTEGVRNQNWAYMTYYDVKPRVEELYDIRKDPLQENNLANDPTAQPQLEELRARYQQYLSQLPPSVLPNKVPEKKLPKKAP
jgi:arylsulfatase A-like enzyme